MFDKAILALLLVQQIKLPSRELRKIPNHRHLNQSMIFRTSPCKWDNVIVPRRVRYMHFLGVRGSLCLTEFV